jgi:hypothetical protein
MGAQGGKYAVTAYGLFLMCALWLPETQGREFQVD